MKQHIKNVTFFKHTLALDILLYIHKHKDDNVYSVILSREFKSADSHTITEVDKLEKAGLIKKIPANEKNANKRIKTLKLTSTSEKLVPHLIEISKILEKK